MPKTRAAVHGVPKGRTRLSDWTTTTAITMPKTISIIKTCIQFSSVQWLSRVQLFVTPWITACQASLSITYSQSSLRLMSIESVMPSSHLILCRPLFFLPPIPPASESFPVSQLFTWGGQSTGVSALASFLPKNTQGWSPLGWTGWISLQSKGFSGVFSNATCIGLWQRQPELLVSFLFCFYILQCTFNYA